MVFLWHLWVSSLLVVFSGELSLVGAHDKSPWRDGPRFEACKWDHFETTFDFQPIVWAGPWATGISVWIAKRSWIGHLSFQLLCEGVGQWPGRPRKTGDAWPHRVPPFLSGGTRSLGTPFPLCLLLLSWTPLTWCLRLFTRTQVADQHGLCVFRSLVSRDLCNSCI